MKRPANSPIVRSSRGMGFFLAVLLAGCASPPANRAFSPTPAEIQLVDLMGRRLEIVRHVAWVKFQNSLPVSDPKREAELLASLVEKGSKLGLPSEDVEVFFRAQIRASCRVQEELIASWRRGATLPAFAPWDLRRHIRPKLDEVSTGLIAAFKEQRTIGRPGLRNYAAGSLRQRGFSWRVAQMAAAPLN